MTALTPHRRLAPVTSADFTRILTEPAVYAHGITANPAIGRYAKLVARLPADAPEKREVALEVPTRQGIPGTGKY